ncbi:MAG TPA: methyltransferase domain-containing protein [Acidimicrobiales bacterium]|nr:methyltransferase domain-containing protein [Acidimicrobiales bacterium]
MTSARYDSVADFYEAGWPDSYDDDLSVTLFDLIGPLAGLAVLDLACGHGRMSRELARRGAQVVGLDISDALLDKARATRYYDEEWWSAEGASSTLRRQVGANHRMLSTYVNTLIRHGLTLQELREPRPPQDWEWTKPEAASRPVFVVARFVKE